MITDMTELIIVCLLNSAMLSIKNEEKNINMKLITIHQPECYPWLGFFNKMLLADEYIILDNIKFRKNYFQNRNQFLTKNGAIFLTVPVEKEANSKIIKDIEIVNNAKWKKKHLNTIKQSYSKSPFFQEYEDFFINLYNQNFKYLIDFNMEIIFYLRDIFNISNKLLFASELEVTGASTELLLSICKNRKADIYISGRDGRNYMETSLFEKENIKIVYHNFTHPEYKQFNSKEFIPYMNTFDLLFNYQKEEAKNIILSGGTFCEE